MQIYMCCHCAPPPANSLTCAVPQVEIMSFARPSFLRPTTSLSCFITGTVILSSTYTELEQQRGHLQ